jgi:hypothetical protein
MRAALALALFFSAAVAGFGAEKKPPLNPITDSTLGELRDYIRTHVAAGFDPEKEIITSAIESLSDEHDADALRPHATRLTRELLAEHRRAQKSWPAVTDCDRLTAAFAALERKGIVARENFSDCQTCGTSEIGEQMEKRAKSGRKVLGYVFYHMQDTERATEGGGLYLSYGTYESAGAEASVAIGREVIAVLHTQGLTTEWNGKLEQRIHVKLDWKRRR